MQKSDTNELDVQTTLFLRAKSNPLFFVKDGFAFNLVVQAREKAGYYGECGVPYFLERMDSIQFLEDRLLRQSSDQLLKYKEAYTRSAQNVSWAAVSNDAQIHSELLFFLNEYIPVHRGAQRASSQTQPTYTATSLPKIHDIIPNPSCIANGRIYKLIENDRGNISIDENRYVLGDDCFTTNSYNLQYNERVAQHLRDEVATVMRAAFIAQTNPIDLACVSVNGTSYEYGRIGYDSSMHLIYEYIPPFTHVSGTVYGKNEIALGASIQPPRLNVGACRVIHKNSNGAFYDENVTLCKQSADGNSLLRAETGIKFDHIYLNQLAGDIAASKYFHTSELSSSSSSNDSDNSGGYS